jgi:hypothetical protein
VAYDAILNQFGVKAPQPIADESARHYRRRLFAEGQNRLPDGHRLVGIDPHKVGGDAIKGMEDTLFEELRREAIRPTGSNVPQTISDPRAQREVTDAMGTRKIEWHARESFIKTCGLNRAGRRVVGFLDHAKGLLLPTGRAPKRLW